MFYNIYSDVSLIESGFGYYSYLILRGHYYLKQTSGPVSTHKSVIGELIAFKEAFNYLITNYDLTENDTVTFYVDNISVYRIVKKLFGNKEDNIIDEIISTYSFSIDFKDTLINIFNEKECRKCKFKVKKLDGHSDTYTPLTLMDRVSRMLLKMSKEDS